MGAWGVGSFENDDAGDWAWELAEAEDTSILDQAFSIINDTDGYIEAPDCSIALAAAEVVAALRGRPASELPEDVTKYVARLGTPPSANLVAAALLALERIKTNSELRELWDESGNSAEWLNEIAHLEARLR